METSLAAFSGWTKALRRLQTNPKTEGTSDMLTLILVQMRIWGERLAWDLEKVEFDRREAVLQ